MISCIQSTLREPLLHFLALGVFLFLAYEAINPGSVDDEVGRIVVDGNSLLTYMQYRAKAFDVERFQQQFDAMSLGQRQQLINDYVREETLYREAKALQLDKNDVVARQRLIQQISYLTQSVITATIELADEELKAYHLAHANRYREPTKITFTHIFFSSAKRSSAEAQLLARQQLNQLNQEQIPFHQALSYGEQFLYHRNYVQKEADFVASHFGQVLQTAVFALPASESRWQGPYPSPYGYHLVLVTQRIAEYDPAFAEIKTRVVQDLMQKKRQDQLAMAIQKMIENYEVIISAELLATPKPKTATMTNANAKTLSEGS